MVTTGRQICHQVAVVEFYQDCVRAAMLEEIAAWALDLEFDAIANELAMVTGTTPMEAGGMLLSTVREVYRRAAGE